MNDEPIDLKKLAEEAAATAYEPRAKKCFPWSHQWTMWEYVNSLKLDQTRRCVRCGLRKEKRCWSLM